MELGRGGMTFSLAIFRTYGPAWNRRRNWMRSVRLRVKWPLFASPSRNLQRAKGRLCDQEVRKVFVSVGSMRFLVLNHVLKPSLAGLVEPFAIRCLGGDGEVFFLFMPLTSQTIHLHHISLSHSSLGKSRVFLFLCEQQCSNLRGARGGVAPRRQQPRLPSQMPCTTVLLRHQRLKSAADR